MLVLAPLITVSAWVLQTLAAGIATTGNISTLVIPSALQGRQFHYQDFKDFLPNGSWVIDQNTDGTIERIRPLAFPPHLASRATQQTVVCKQECFTPSDEPPATEGLINWAKQGNLLHSESREHVTYGTCRVYICNYDPAYSVGFTEKELIHGFDMVHYNCFDLSYPNKADGVQCGGYWFDETVQKTYGYTAPQWSICDNLKQGNQATTATAAQTTTAT